jgi:trehalose synthase
MAHMEGITCICNNGRTLEEHRGVVGDAVIASIRERADALAGTKILHVNSTYQSGGVAEMILSLVPLLNDVGVETEWKILEGDHDFFTITKNFHNGLQGEPHTFPDAEKSLYLRTSEEFAPLLGAGHDCVIIHDPQPLPLIAFAEKEQPWIWRCHVDLSNPDESLWSFLQPFVERYDRMIISHDAYRRPQLAIGQTICHPAIDPLSEKNREMDADEIARLLAAHAIPTDKPLITQISRFDKWKDPAGVVEVFRLVRRHRDCRLVLCGSMAPDDPEGWTIYAGVEAAAADLIATGDVILITEENNSLVNALQRASAVILQKSLREGFGLTVTEALWKERPVVASRIGGIPLQITDGETGYLVEPHDTGGFAGRVLAILDNPAESAVMGSRGREYVREHFLITRLLSDYLALLGRELVPRTSGGAGAS